MLIWFTKKKFKDYFAIGMFLIGIMLFGASMSLAKSTQPMGGDNSSSSFKKVSFQGDLLAKEISKTTGIAMNPLLCISALGAYEYYTTIETERPTLPWHASPNFWLPLVFIMALIFLKDSSKIVVPKLLAVPFDAIETLVEKNVSGLIALPVLFSAFNSGEFEQIQLLSQHTYDFLFPVAFASDAVNGAISSGSSIVTTIITSITIFVIYIVVWVVSQAFNVLILLCPFSTIDTLLATAKNSIVAVIVGLGNTYVGLVFSIIVIAISTYLFPKGLRLVVFGTIMSYDIIVFKILNKSVHKNFSNKKINGFSSCYLSNVPPLTYGTIHQHNQMVKFSYKPFYVLKKTTLNISGIKTSDCELENGILSPILSKKESPGRSKLQLFRIRAMYCKHFELIAESLDVTQANETSVGKKFQEAFLWCKTLLKKSPRLNSNLEKISTEEQPIVDNDQQCKGESQLITGKKNNNWIRKGIESYKSGGYKEAVIAFSNAIEDGQNTAQAYFYRACSYQKLKDKPKQKEDILVAAKLGHPKAIDFLNKSAKKTKRQKNAEQKHTH